jgi:hypothetical protein
MPSLTRSPFSDPRRPQREELRRWVAGYARVESRQRQLIRDRGIDHDRIGGISRDMIDAALAPGSRTILKDAERLRGEQAVRRTWRRLRSGLVP